ncbi:MAG: GNAT family N-acetyltransferase [Ilumatobacteraceae bacterium]
MVRRAVADDAVPLAFLEGEARAALVDTRGGNRWLEEHPVITPGWVDAVSARDVFVAVLAFTGDPEVVVGYLVLDVDGTIARVDQVYVTAEARELGFGDALLELATEVARATGAVVLEGQALPGDRQTKNLYERAGITARLITVSTRLA